MTEERDRTGPRKSHRLAWGAALSVVVMTLCAPLAGAAGVEVPQLPVENPVAPDLPVIPDLPAVPEVTTLPAPVEELDGNLPPVLDGVTDAVDEVAGDTGDAVDETTDGAIGGVVDEVTETVEEVTDTGGGMNDTVEETVDPVTDTVDDVTGPVEETVNDVRDELGNNGGGLAERVGGVLEEVLGGSSQAPGDPATAPTGASGVGPNAGGSGSTGAVPTDVKGLRTGSSTDAATVPIDGFAANLVAAGDAPFASEAARTDPAGPSLVERIARSASEVAGRIAFPMLLALAVAAFIVVQNHIDRKDPKLALAAVDAEEDLLGFE